jgi:YegS/Rv2252/BmrU family lipid kinase
MLLKKIVLLCNPTPENRHAKTVADELLVLLSARHISHTLFVAAWPAHLEGYTEAWIIGGDGTLNWFINHYPDLSIPITVFKGGSGNDFHWMLYGDVTVTEQVGRVLLENTQHVDAGRCNGQLFLVGVGVGFDGAIVRDLLGKKKLAGKASYLLSILKNIALYAEHVYEIFLEGKKIAGACLLISVANGKRFGGGFVVAPLASLTDGLLDLNVIGKVAAYKRIMFLSSIEKGQHLRHPFVQYEQAGSVRITSPTPVHAHVDGEYIFANTFEIECLPNKFLFLV